jgi:hypothetical protein
MNRSSCFNGLYIDCVNIHPVQWAKVHFQPLNVGNLSKTRAYWDSIKENSKTEAICRLATIYLSQNRTKVSQAVLKG